MNDAGPLEVVVADLLRRPGERRAYEAQVRLGGLGISTASVPDDIDVRLELVFEVTGSSLVVEGTVYAPWQGDCRRCLEQVRDEVAISVRELFERRAVDGETYPLREDRVDLEPMVRDAILLSLPLAPLCTEDCTGPDPERFPARPEAEQEQVQPDESTRDPRWAALDQLRLDN